MLVELSTLEGSSRESSFTPVPRTVFSVSDVAQEDRFGLWKESISCIFDVERGGDLPREEFRARVEACLLGELMLARTASVRQSWARSASTIARDGMDHYMIQLFVDGAMEADHKCGGISVPCGSLVVFDLSREVSSRTSDFVNLSLVVPRVALSGFLRSPDDQHMRVLSTRNPVVALLSDHIVRLERMTDSISATQASDIASATTALVGACLNGVDAGTPTDPQEVCVPHFILVKRLIEQNFTDPSLSVDRIARMAGLSRTRLYTLFEPVGGVNGYVRERRLRTALATLLDTRKRYRPIYDIAAGCGFVNESAFSRAFRHRFGCSPREARRQSAVPHGDRNNATGSRRYEHWLQQLSP